MWYLMGRKEWLSLHRQVKLPVCAQAELVDPSQSIAPLFPRSVLLRPAQVSK